MNFDGAKDEFVLASGRRVYAHGGTLGIAPARDDDGIAVSEGWDGGLGSWHAPFTQEEKREIAAYCIDLWRQWAEQESVVDPEESQADMQGQLARKQQEQEKERKFWASVHREIAEAESVK